MIYIYLHVFTARRASFIHHRELQKINSLQFTELQYFKMNHPQRIQNKLYEFAKDF